MEFTGEKLAVFRQIQDSSSPIGIKKILQKLGPDFKERSVRRWLVEMIQKGLIEKIGNRRATKYRAVFLPEIKRENGCFSPKSLPAIALVQRPIYERPPVAYDEEWFLSYVPNSTYYIPKEIRIHLTLAGNRSRDQEPAGTYAHQIFNRLLIDLSYNSSRLEGNTYSLLDTQKLILEGKNAEGKLDEETTMILNHKEAIRYLVDQIHQIDFSSKTFCTIHYLLADGLIEGAYVGKVRNHGVRIGGSTYIPYENPALLQQRLDQIAQKASLIGDPYEQSFFLLVHLSYIQAFIDVNKRTARLCANIPLIKQNLVPLSFNEVDQENYTSAILAIYELQDVQPLLDVYASSYLRTCSLYDATVKALGFDEVRVRYRMQRRAAIRDIVLRDLHGAMRQEYMMAQAKEKVAKQDQSDFLEDIEEDFRLMDESRIVGLGFSFEEFTAWKKRENIP